MSNALEDATKRAIGLFGDDAAHEWLRLMNEEERLCTTRCPQCGVLAWPPRPFCPACQHDEIEWVDIGEGATLYAFTWQSRSLRFGKPEVIGLVDLPGLGRIVSAIDARFEDLEIGAPLELGFVEIQEGIKVHRFRPAR